MKRSEMTTDNDYDIEIVVRLRRRSTKQVSTEATVTAATVRLAGKRDIRSMCRAFAHAAGQGCAEAIEQRYGTEWEDFEE